MTTDEDLELEIYVVTGNSNLKESEKIVNKVMTSFNNILGDLQEDRFTTDDVYAEALTLSLMLGCKVLKLMEYGVFYIVFDYTHELKQEDIELEPCSIEQRSIN